ncbi:MAG: DUF177 domain-containing protein [Alphaproteobacteria bacterium]|nr:DUF177 domain-containing protein [Alphaproteobacteria bacterium]
MVATPEFSRILALSRLGESDAVHRFAASAAECAALARRFGLLSLDRFTVEARLSREAGGVRLAARIEAELVQECVVTLDPVPARLAEDFAILYRRRLPQRSDILDPLEEDVELLEGDEIDLAEAAAQQLSLILDPFPRSPSARLVDDPPAPAAPPPPAHPFAALARLVKK